MTRLLAIPGSLRAGSSNAALLECARLLLDEGVEWVWFDGLAELPAFNPDADVEPAHDAVARWRGALAAAQGVMLSSPEYAHGVPGALKNALDWVVGSGELVNKPIALLNPSPHSEYAHPQLAEILRTMNANVVPDACVTIGIPRRGAEPSALVAQRLVAEPLRAALAALLDATR